MIFARRFLDEWIKSQPHRENLAFAAYDRTGVGAAVNGDTVYVAELFASDLGLKPKPADETQAPVPLRGSEAGRALEPRRGGPNYLCMTEAGRPGYSVSDRDPSFTLYLAAVTVCWGH